MTKIDIDKLTQRTFDPSELVNALRGNMTVWSWGAHAWTKNEENTMLRFTVNGHHHKGHVYITLAWNDTFTVTLTSNRGNVKHSMENVYIDMLIDVIDDKVEYIEGMKK